MSKIEFRNLNPNRKFKGIWIPEYLWFYEGLTINEKVFYLEIDSLDNEQGCFASNEHFSKFSGLSKNRCSEVIKSLESKGIVTVELIYKFKAGKISKEVDKRIIRVNPNWERNLRAEYERQYDEYRNMINSRKDSKEPITNEEEKPSSDPIREIEGGVFEKSKGVFEKSNPLFEKSKDSNTILDIQDSNTNDDDTEKENLSSSTSFTKELGLFKETWNQHSNNPIKILTANRKELIIRLIMLHGIDTVLEAIKNISNSEYLKNNMIIDIFLTKEDIFVKVLENCYKSWEPKIKGPKAIDHGMYSHEWDFDEIEELERAYIDRKLAEQQNQNMEK